MKKETIRQAFFMACNKNEDLRYLAKVGRITEKQEDLAVVFGSMPIKMVVEVVEHHRELEGTKADVIKFFDNGGEVFNITKKRAAAYICNHPGDNWFGKKTKK